MPSAVPARRFPVPRWLVFAYPAAILACMLGVVVFLPWHLGGPEGFDVFLACVVFLPVLVVRGTPVLGLALRGEPLLSLDEEGIHDRRLGFGTIAWADVEHVEAGRDEVWVQVRGLARYRAAETFLAGLSTSFERFAASATHPDRIAIRVKGTGLDPGQLATLLREARALPATPGVPAEPGKKPGAGESGGSEDEA